MHPSATNILAALDDPKILDFRDDPAGRREDHKKVHIFMGLMGHPDRPFGKLDPRPKPEFEADLRRLGGQEFFDPFNKLLELINRPRLRVEPSQEAIDAWNVPEVIPTVVSEICDRLDKGTTARLVPNLVAAFLNLEAEEVPTLKEWPNIDAIAVPGSRTIDRAAEAFRAYLRTNGHAWIVASGRVPYWEKPEDVPILEAEANAAYLRLLGVPRGRIIEETTSRDTAENVQFLPQALQEIEERRGKSVQSILLVTSPFHLARYKFNVQSILTRSGKRIKVFALGSKASRYWAETYFVADPKSNYKREKTMEVVFNEYAKIAVDLCAVWKPASKADAQRGPRP